MTIKDSDGLLYVICKQCQERVQVLVLHLPKHTCPICGARL